MRYLISILGLALVVGIGYFAVAQYVSVAHGQSGLMQVDRTSDAVSASGAQVIGLLNRLKQINLDGKIFSNPNFLTLQDWSVEVPTQEIGRSNPYLPAYGAVPAVDSSTRVSLPRR